MSAMVYLGIEVGDDLSNTGDSHRLQLLMTLLLSVGCDHRCLLFNAHIALPRTTTDLPRRSLVFITRSVASKFTGSVLCAKQGRSQETGINLHPHFEPELGSASHSIQYVISERRFPSQCPVAVLKKLDPTQKTK